MPRTALGFALRTVATSRAAAADISAGFFWTTTSISSYPFKKDVRRYMPDIRETQDVQPDQTWSGITYGARYSRRTSLLASSEKVPTKRSVDGSNWRDGPRVGRV